MTMLLLRDLLRQADAEMHLKRHLDVVADAHTGRIDLGELHAAKLANILPYAAKAPLYRDWLPQLLDRAHTDKPSTELLTDIPVLVTELLRDIPLLVKGDSRTIGYDTLALPMGQFLHYYETSGTTGPPMAAPKALEDLIANTVNIGEMWARLLKPSDVALILIIAPLGPAPYQFEKVFEYLGMMSVRPWVEYIDGDYTRVLDLIDTLSVNVFVGAPSRLLAMIQFAARHHRPIPHFDHVLLLAEQTGAAQLRHLSHLTSGHVCVGTYGSSETGTIAVTCEHSQLHLQMQSYILELIDDQGIRLIDGSADSGELVVTTLDLISRPLLRYRTGDLIEVDGGQCPCGLALPVIRTRGRAKPKFPLGGGALNTAYGCEQLFHVLL
jgi:phenylacetate-CoA ligase